MILLKNLPGRTIHKNGVTIAVLDKRGRSYSSFDHLSTFILFFIEKDRFILNGRK